MQKTAANKRAREKAMAAALLAFIYLFIYFSFNNCTKKARGIYAFASPTKTVFIPMNLYGFQYYIVYASRTFKSTQRTRKVQINSRIVHMLLRMRIWKFHRPHAESRIPFIHIRNDS